MSDSCPLLGAKRTCLSGIVMSANDPKRTIHASTRSIEPIADLNPKDLSIIIVSDVLNDQECHDEQGYSGSDKERNAGSFNVWSVAGYRPDEKVESDR